MDEGGWQSQRGQGWTGGHSHAEAREQTREAEGDEKGGSMGVGETCRRARMRRAGHRSGSATMYRAVGVT